MVTLCPSATKGRGFARSTTPSGRPSPCLSWSVYYRQEGAREEKGKEGSSPKPYVSRGLCQCLIPYLPQLKESMC